MGCFQTGTKTFSLFSFLSKEHIFGIEIVLQGVVVGRMKLRFLINLKVERQLMNVSLR